MKQWIIVLTLLVCLQLAASKISEKTPTKKLTKSKKKSSKSSPKNTLDAFKDLSEDDLEFIKELDKQFKEHGDNIKITVERDNSTTKTAKRTIEGELGYGYYDEPASRYQFSQPRYMIYPYSQNDIPPSAPAYSIPSSHHGQPNFQVSVQPSYSYEIKQTNQGYDTHSSYNNQGYETTSPYAVPQHHQTRQYLPPPPPPQPPAEKYQEPVIVLRIPGPQKYASHLQSLLQQYIEIRAAQYLRLIQETEAQQQHYADVPDFQQAHYQQEEPQQQQQYQQQQEVQYQPIQEVYQQYKGKQVEYPQYEQVQENRPHDEQQQYVYVPTAQQEEQQVYYQPQHVLYGVPEDYQQEQPAEASPHLPTTENNPRESHTQVVFSHQQQKADQSSAPHTLPSIRPFERHSSKASPIYSQEYNHQETHQSLESDYQQPSDDNHVVEVTQKPYNYHAHSLSMRARTSKRGVVSRDEQYMKLGKLIDRLKTKELEEKRLH